MFLLTFLSINVQAEFAKGADISWQTEQINAGYSWKNDSGDDVSLHDVLKDHAMNSIRLRVWVSPSDGWNNKADVVTKAVWAKNAGMRIMIDFHYSDTWADPAKQTMPSQWNTATIADIRKEIRKHTKDVLLTLKQNQIYPEWVQIGNETNDGMLWPYGRASINGFKNYAKFIKSGAKMAKTIFPNIKTIVHLANGDNLGVLEWNLDGLVAEKTDFDIIGLSLYPGSEWLAAVDSYEYNLIHLQKKYGKKVMLVEVGMNAAPIQTSYDAIFDIIERTKTNEGLGVFYWEPQGYNDWDGYSKHTWANSGAPTWALDAFYWAGN